MVPAAGARYSLNMRYLPIPNEIADEARATLRDRFGHRLAVTREAAPCRSCLRVSRDPKN